MTTGSRRQPARASLLLAVIAMVAASRPAWPISLDDRGEAKLSMRAYTAVRVGTQRMGGTDNPLTFPGSELGHVRQSRYFLQLDFDHDLTRLAHQTWGLARLFGMVDEMFDAVGWKGKTDV